MSLRSVSRGHVLPAVLFALGSAGTLAAQEPVVYSLVGTHRWDEFGVAVAPVGDIDDDGAPDFVVGADQPFITSPPPPGYVQLFSGKTGKPLRTWYGEEPGDGFGREIAAVGDLDGDKKIDFAAASEGTVILLISPATGAVLHRIEAQYGEPHLHYFHLAGSPDVDGDAIPDLIVGDPALHVSRGPETDLNVGRVSVHSGTGASRFWLRTGEEETDVLGTSVAAVGDVDGDALPDVAVGKPRGIHAVYKSSQTLGEVLVLRGVDGALLHVLEKPSPYFNFGEAMANLGDLNGDGSPELAIAAPGYAESGGYSRGWVGIYSAKTFEVLMEYVGTAGYVFSKSFHGDALGFSLSSAGDAD